MQRAAAISRPAGAAAILGGEISPADLIAAVMPAVVNVSTVLASRLPTIRSAQDLPPEIAPNTVPPVTHGFGSGFIIDKGGIIVTNRHVVEHAIRITVTLQDNTTLTANRIGRLSRAGGQRFLMLPLQPDG